MPQAVAGAQADGVCLVGCHRAQGGRDAGGGVSGCRREDRMGVEDSGGRGVGGAFSWDAGGSCPVSAGGRNHLNPASRPNTRVLFDRTLKRRSLHVRHCSQRFKTLTRWTLRQPHEEDTNATATAQNKKPGPERPRHSRAARRPGQSWVRARSGRSGS